MNQGSELRVVLVGEESAGVQVLHALKKGNYSVVAVMASPPSGAKAPVDLWVAAARLGYETWPAKLVKDAATAWRLAGAGVDLILNVHSLYVMHAEVLKAARIGAFNLHPGPLPRYAGLNAVSWAIYRGEAEHGVTVHRMEPEIDAGAISYQARFPISEADNALSLSAKCTRAGLPLVIQLLETAARDPAAIPSIPQDFTSREYFGREVPRKGRIDWSARAKQVVNFVRAFDYAPFRSPWGHPRTAADGHQIEVLKASLTGRPCNAPPGTLGGFEKNGVLVATADEWVSARHLRVDGSVRHPREVLYIGQRLRD